MFENVLVGLRFGRTSEVADANRTAMEMMERARLDDRPNVLAGSLTLFQRKRLELARALATQPRLLLLDEIAGGLIEAEVDELIETIRDLRSSGTTIVWIEHVVHALLSVVDRLVAIDFGRVLTEGMPAQVIASREVQAVYMGVEDE